MQELSSRKRLAVIRHYLRGDSYDVIAARTGVSKGSVAAIVADLKAGRIPEVQEPADQLDLLREVAVELRKASVTLEQAMVGLTVQSRLHELRIEPAEIERWAAVYRRLAQDESTLRVFIRTALLVEEVRDSSGLTVEGLEARIRGLQDEAERLEPAVKSLQQCEKSLQDLQGRENEAAAEAVKLEKRRDELRIEVADKEKREADLARRVERLEDRAVSGEERLATARRGLGVLEDLGLSAPELSGFAQRVAGIAQRHAVGPGGLRDRLLAELERLEECLTLEVAVEARKGELAKLVQEVSVTAEEKAAEAAAVKELHLEKASLGKAVRDETALLRREIATMAKAIREATGELTRGLGVALSNAVAPIEELREKALELGQELGHHRAILDSNEYIRGLSSLITGTSQLTAGQTRLVVLAVMRPAYEWMRLNQAQLSLPKDLMTSLGWCIKDLERWQP